MFYKLILVLTIVQIVFSKDDEFYVVPENIDVKEILQNQRLLKNYANCVLDKGKCTPEGLRLKAGIIESLENECAKCDEKLRDDTRKVIHHIVENLPDLWKELEAKFDPNGDYKKRYKDYIEKEKLNI